MNRYVIVDRTDRPAMSGGKVLTFWTERQAIDAAEQWTMAGAHLGADWRVRLLTKAEKRRLSLTDRTNIHRIVPTA